MFRIIVLISLIGVMGFATSKWGSECGLTDDKDESWKEISRPLYVGRLKAAKIAKLPTLTKQQIIITAKDFAKGDDDAPKIKKTVEAIEYLKRADGPYVTNYQVRGRRYTEVIAYPGDNPVGLVFEYGSRHVVASNGDDSIECR